MSEIKSKKASEYIHEYIPWAYMTLAIKTIQIAEQEAEERHAKEIQDLRDECEKWRTSESESRQRESLAVKLCDEKRKVAEELRDRAGIAFYYSCNACDGDGGCRLRDNQACQMSCKKAKLLTQKLTEKL